MKQFQLEEVKFPVLKPVQQQKNISKKDKNSSHSELIRIIIALLIAIFIYNQSQQTTINYNEIIKNQKMFLVKNIRGVFPTLNGSVLYLQNVWNVSHFENYFENESQIFNNFTFKFLKDDLVVENEYCGNILQYSWKNYSYNFDLQTLKSSMSQPFNSSQIQAKPQQSHTSQLNPQWSKSTSSQYSNQTLIQENPGTSQKQVKCLDNLSLLEQTLMKVSVWTISENYLYLLIENPQEDEDFYLILHSK